MSEMTRILEPPESRNRRAGPCASFRVHAGSASPNTHTYPCWCGGREGDASEHTLLDVRRRCLPRISEAVPGALSRLSAPSRHGWQMKNLSGSVDPVLARTVSPPPERCGGWCVR